VPAYLILDIRVKDPDEYAAYREAAQGTLEPYGGRYLVRGGEIEVVEGDWSPERLVVVEFPSVQHAHDWYQSPEYQKALPLRLRAAPGNTVLVEGVS
jgi:uncharacterized protein (DUF1330 family)